MSDDRPPAAGSEDVEPVDASRTASEQAGVTGVGAESADAPAPVDGPALVDSPVTGARPTSLPAFRTQSRITVAALVVAVAAVVLLVVSIVQHG
ncbi:MAG: hypothetical protein R2743_02585 [Ilumatobacteraceae bacterium]